MWVCDSVILVSAKCLGQDSAVSSMVFWKAAGLIMTRYTAVGFRGDQSQTDEQVGIWGHIIILYYFGSHVQLVHILFRATILPLLITFHLRFLLSNALPLLFFSCVLLCYLVCSICNLSRCWIKVLHWFLDTDLFVCWCMGMRWTGDIGPWTQQRSKGSLFVWYQKGCRIE